MIRSNFIPCCDVMKDQTEYKCDVHSPICPDQVVVLGRDGPYLRAENAEYVLRYCPWCGTKISNKREGFCKDCDLTYGDDYCSCGKKKLIPKDKD
jgi:hypothetical protein